MQLCEVGLQKSLIPWPPEAFPEQPGPWQPPGHRHQLQSTAGRRAWLQSLQALQDKLHGVAGARSLGFAGPSSASGCGLLRLMMSPARGRRTSLGTSNVPPSVHSPPSHTVCLRYPWLPPMHRDQKLFYFSGAEKTKTRVSYRSAAAHYGQPQHGRCLQVDGAAPLLAGQHRAYLLPVPPPQRGERIPALSTGQQVVVTLVCSFSSPRRCTMEIYTSEQLFQLVFKLKKMPVPFKNKERNPSRQCSICLFYFFSLRIS